MKGNKAYQERKFAEAVDYYTRAIEVSPKPDPVFYSNRAACQHSIFEIILSILITKLGYMYYSTPDFEKAVNDCSEALKINPRHERSLQRRGTALEKLGKLEESLRGEYALVMICNVLSFKMGYRFYSCHPAAKICRSIFVAGS